MRVYLDNNASTMVAPEAVEAMTPHLLESFGNASSFHSFGSLAREAIEEARSRVAALLGAKASEIIFTSCGTESDNWALKSVLAAAGERGGRPALFVANSDDRRVPKEIAFELAEAAGPAAEVLIVPGESHGGAWRNGTAAYESAAASLLEAAQGTSQAAASNTMAANEDSR